MIETTPSTTPSKSSTRSVVATEPPSAQQETVRELEQERDGLRAAVRFLQGELQAQIDYAAALSAALAQGFEREKRRRGSPLPTAGDVAACLAATRRLGLRLAVRKLREIRAIRASGGFEEAYYRAQRPDLRSPTVSPVRHYVFNGAAEGLDPSRAFSTRGYLTANPDVAASGPNPFAHYLRVGLSENRFAPSSVRTLKTSRGHAGLHQPGGKQAIGFVSRQTWPMARDPSQDREELDPYEKRPDDEVPVEGTRGEGFLHGAGLLSAQPDFNAATAALNASERVLDLAGADAPAPDVSIIIPVYGQLAYTLNCLDALLSHESRRRAEIIIVDDASPDPSAAHLPRVNGVRYMRQPANRGFIAACNAGAAEARGRWLVFLNNDTRVVAGWLDQLIDSFERFPRAGLVGSKLFYPDGSLQEAGGIVWQDASGWNYGRDDDPNRPQYSHARQVDYVSGASIAVPADVWREMDGFDAHYAPAYYEDTDLAFRLRRAGREVWFQPGSRVIHYEGKTAGTDLTAGAKAYQAENQRKFLDRWRGELASHRANGHSAELERERQVEKRVLVIEATTPTPDQDAGSVWVVNIIRVFQALGYKTSFAPIDNFLYQDRYSGPLQALGVECLYAPYVTSLQDHLVESGHLYDVVYVFRYEMLEASARMIRQYCPDAELVFNNHDLHYLRLERQAEVEQSAALAREAGETKIRELRVMADADVVCVPSPVEKQVIEAEGFSRPVVLMPFMTDLEPPAAPWSARREVVFLGGFAHPPNIDSAVWMVDAIWSRLAGDLPGARLLIVGSNPTAEIKALARPSVEVTGRIDDLRPVFEDARVFVAPLRFGAGVKGKIFTAFAHGLPVVTTSIGAEGMGLVDGVHALIADTPEDFAARVRDVYADEALWERLSRGGLAYIEENATIRRGVQVMQEILTLAERSRLMASPLPEAAERPPARVT